MNKKLVVGVVVLVVLVLAAYYFYNSTSAPMSVDTGNEQLLSEEDLEGQQLDEFDAGLGFYQADLSADEETYQALDEVGQ